MENMQLLFKFDELLRNIGLNSTQIDIVNVAITIIIIIGIAYFSDILFKKVIISIITRVIKHTNNTWDDIFLENKVFNRLSHLAPALVIYIAARYLLADYDLAREIIQGGLKIYMIIVSIMVINSFLSSLLVIYSSLPVAKNRPIKGYMQVVQIIIYSLAIILILSILMGKSPTKLLAGLGALAAVLILVFKDTILGFTASIQLSANQMVQIGDWISMPKYGADGNVTEITLNTVKVRNWDKTISTIPTYSLVTDSFSNWRGMEQAGGRRIKRSINIDLRSVKFCTPELLDKLKKVIYLKDYIEQKQEEIAKYNKDNNIDESIVVNGRRMTNLGTFRKYLEFYLRNHPMIRQDLTFLVRQLQSTEKGVPIEIYVFSKDIRWPYYEAIQSDIFDHIMAVISEFELRLFQNPSGEDFRALLKN